jgi:hypothetical protein
MEQIEFTQATAATKVENIEITSDGTVGGTTVKVNGKAIKNLSQANFSLYTGTYDNDVYFSFTTKDSKPAPGELCQETYFRLVPPSSKAVAALQEPIVIERTNVAPPAPPAKSQPADSLREIYRSM